MNIKQEIIQGFKNYIASRTGFWGKIISFLFRNRELTAKNINIAKIVVNALEQKNEMSNESILSLLEHNSMCHRAFSKAQGKNHFNFGITRHDREREDIHSDLTLTQAGLHVSQPDYRKYKGRKEWDNVPLYKNVNSSDSADDVPTHFLYGVATETDYQRYAQTKTGHTVLKKTTPNHTFYFFSQGFYNGSSPKVCKNRSCLADVFNYAIHKLGG